MSRRDDLEARFSEVASELASWRSLAEHPSWANFAKILDEQKALRMNTLLAPVANVGALFPQEFMKGEASGLHLAINMPQLRLEALEAEKKRLEYQLANLGDRDEPQNAGTETRTDGRGGSRVDDERFSRDE